MSHLSERDYDDRWDDFTDLLDDGRDYFATEADKLWERHIGSARTDAELHGTPWPNSPLEAASFEYEIAHWR